MSWDSNRWVGQEAKVALLSFSITDNRLYTPVCTGTILDLGEVGLLIEDPEDGATFIPWTAVARVWQPKEADE